MKSSENIELSGAYFGNAPSLIRDASFFGLQPKADVTNANGDTQFETVDIEYADYICICAYFATKPPRLLVVYQLYQCNLILNEMRGILRGRPAFYIAESCEGRLSTESSATMRSSIAKINSWEYAHFLSLESYSTSSRHGSDFRTRF